MSTCRSLSRLRIVHVSHSSSLVVDILSKWLIIEVASDAFILWNLIEVIDTFVNAEFTLTAIDDLDFLENLHDQLCIHHRVGFSIREFASKKEIALIELIDESCKGNTIVDIFLNLGDLRKSLNGILEENLIFFCNLEVSDELGNR